jgi:O-acetyl-ADP-ribose deacetylase (regulator of RNase III)
MKKQVGSVTIEIVQGDIASQPDIDVLVNAANAQLMPGGGVAGVIHRAAGPGLAEECRPLAPIAPGQAVITGAHNLENSHVIHCLGPVYGTDKPEDELLANCYRNALGLADNHGLESIGFPAISTGAFGYPPEEAATVAFGTVKEMADKLKSVKLVRFVLFSKKDLELHTRVAEQIFT